MIPISQEKILKRIESFRKQKHPEFDKHILAESFIFGEYGELNCFSERPFFTLQELLLSNGEIYLSHNGSISLGIPVEELAGNYEYHHMTNKDLNGDLILGNYQRKSTGKTEYSFFQDNSFDSISLPLDICFIEKFFGLWPNTFPSAIVEPGYGLRVDARGQMGDLLNRVLEEKIPLFIHTIDLERYNDEKRAYVINGFEI